MVTDRLSSTFGALADPTRRAILKRLSQGETTVAELSKPFQISAPAISKHLKVLEGAGLITKSRQSRFRPCRLEAPPLKEAMEWIGIHCKEWESRMDRLEHYLRTLEAHSPVIEETHPNRKEPRA